MFRRAGAMTLAKASPAKSLTPKAAIKLGFACEAFQPAAMAVLTQVPGFVPRVKSPAKKHKKSVAKALFTEENESNTIVYHQENVAFNEEAIISAEAVPVPSEEVVDAFTGTAHMEPTAENFVEESLEQASAEEVAAVAPEVRAPPEPTSFTAMAVESPTASVTASVDAAASNPEAAKPEESVESTVSSSPMMAFRNLL